MNLNEQVGVTLPAPKGYKVLIAVPSLERKSKGGIVLPEESMKREDMASVLGYVVARGPESYTGRDENGDLKFPSGAYCKPGDWVALRSYTGTSFTVASLKEATLPNGWGISSFRLINDISVEAVVPVPEEVFKP